MKALSAAGDPAGAVLHARLHERLLREELGISPDAEIVALVQQLQSDRSQEPSAPANRTPAQFPTDAPDVANAAMAKGSPPGVRYLRGRRLAMLTAGLGAVV